MIGAKALMLVMVLGGAEIHAVEYDIPFFMENHDIRKETLRRCHQDYRLAVTAECENAEAAGTLQLGRPLPPLEAEKKPTNPTPRRDPPQVGKGKDRVV